MLEHKDIIFVMTAHANRRRAEVGPENVFDFSIGSPSVAPPERLHQAIREVIDEGDISSIHRYSMMGGLPETRDKIAEDLNQRFGSSFTGKNIYMTCAANSALAHSFRAVAEPGETILTFVPTFSEYEVYVKGAGCKLEYVPCHEDDLSIDFEAFEEMLTEDVAAVLINSPNNPSGIVYDTPTIKQIAEILERKSNEFGRPVYLISDEPYREIVFSGSDAPFISNFYDNTLVCYSFSKSLSMPGERIGYVAVNPKAYMADTIVDMFAEVSRQSGHNGAPVIWQRVLAKVLPCTADLSIYEKNANILYEALTDFGYDLRKPDGSFYMMPKIPGGDADAFYKKALDNDIIVVPGDGFNCPKYFRIAYCVPTEMVERSLDRFAKLL